MTIKTLRDDYRTIAAYIALSRPTTRPEAVRAANALRRLGEAVQIVQAEQGRLFGENGEDDRRKEGAQ